MGGPITIGRAIRLGALVMVAISATLFLRMTSMDFSKARRISVDIHNYFVRTAPPDLLLNVHPWNVTSRPLHIMYNRVPKCGSSATINLVANLSKENNFDYINTDGKGGVNYWSSGTTWQNNLVDQLDKRPRPFVYQQHLHFVDFTRFGKPQPVYINLIRDPVERLASWYYFRRFKRGHSRSMGTAARNMSFDECVSMNKSECVSASGKSFDLGYFKIIPFFCGQDTFCREDGDKALETAKNNVKEQFGIVGVTEEHEQFIAALEYLYPSIFKGASERFRILGKNRKDFKNDGPVKHSVSEKTATKMKSIMKREYAFYNFVKEHFHRLLNTIEYNKKIRSFF